MVDLTYMFVALIIGLFLGIVAILYLFGSAARTWGLANMFKQPILGIPRSSRREDFTRVREIDEKGNYHVINQTRAGPVKRTYRIDPRKVLMVGKTSFSTVLETFGMNVDEKDAVLAELKEAKESDTDGPTFTKDGFNVSWAALQRQLKEWLGPDHIAALWAGAIGANQQLPLKKDATLTKRSILPFIIIGGIVVVAIVAVVLLRQFKII